MATKIQVTIDCADPERLARFWADALGYKIEDAPAGFATWRSYWRSVGIPEDELGDGDCNDSIVDPTGTGPRIWFQAVPERKTVKNRLHLDLDASGGRAVPLATRKLRVEAEAERLVAAGATRLRELEEGGGYFVVMQDPEGNEFCIH
jgi:catechol 2,3-dioxygenase-like lactoylglutathione lyase family enzyme